MFREIRGYVLFALVFLTPMLFMLAFYFYATTKSPVRERGSWADAEVLYHGPVISKEQAQKLVDERRKRRF